MEKKYLYQIRLRFYSAEISKMELVKETEYFYCFKNTGRWQKIDQDYKYFTSFKEAQTALIKWLEGEVERYNQSIAKVINLNQD